MKFRNKATKEIRKAEMRDDGIYLFSETAEEWRKCDWKVLAKYWEEYREEPEEYWYVNPSGGVDKIALEDDDPEDTEGSRGIGNYFLSREEAERAVEKLRAWKRSKDKGFRFTGFTHKDRGRLDELEIYCQLGERPEDIEDMEDVHLLFGGEE